MNILIISATPSDKSFVAAIVDSIASLGSINKSLNVNVRDLYKLNFNPVLSNQELNDSYKNVYTGDVICEQELLRDADICVWVYPLWWGGMPAIMRGYIDRVFAYGFAYLSESGNTIGLLKDKRNVVIQIIGSSKDKYDNNGMTKAIETINSDGIFKFCESSVEKNFNIFSIYELSPDERLKELTDIKDYFSHLITAGV